MKDVRLAAFDLDGTLLRLSLPLEEACPYFRKN